MKFYTESQLNKNRLLKEGNYTSIKDMLERISLLIPNEPVLEELTQDKKSRVTYTAASLWEEVNALADGLLNMNLKGSHVAIVSENSCRYIITDATVSSGVGVVTPIDKDAPESLMETLFCKCEADVVFCHSLCLKKVAKVAENCPLIKKIITMDKKVEGYDFYEEITSDGKAHGGMFKSLSVDPDSIVKILFTSGTTGANKGVVLTSANLAANMINCMNTVKAPKKGLNTSMSVLPMHHATEINTHIMARVGSGRLTYICHSMRDLMTDMKIFAPTCITIVPMIANMIYKTIWMNAKKEGKEELLKKGIKLCKAARIFGLDLTHKIFKDLFANFGGNLKQIVCGGAMLNPEVVKGFRDLGVFVENGYGITECGPLISINSNTLEDPYSVGPACPGLEVKIADPDENGFGELCVKGPSVAKGYYKDEQATAQVFMQDGFFKTGDTARIEKNGALTLSGRKKNVIVLENGKNVCPEEIEHEIEMALEYCTENVVYSATFITGNGTEQKVICAGLYIPEEKDRKDTERIKQDIESLNSALPGYKHIQFVYLPEKEYEKTSSRKIKRINFKDKFTAQDGIVME